MRVRVPLQWKLVVMLVGLVLSVSAATVLAWYHALTSNGAAEHLMDETGQRFVQMVLLNTLLWMCVVGLLASLYVNRITLPLARIAAATSAVESGNFDVVVPVPEGDEMEAFTTQFNHLVKSLREQRAQIERLIDELNHANASLASDVRRSERLAALGTLSAGLAHELNNVLNNINGYTRVLQSEAGSEEPFRSDLQIIQRECRKAAELIQRYLLFARPARLERRPVSIEALLDACLAVLELPMRSHDISLVRAMGPDIPPLECDPALLEQAIFNVMLNAIQAMKGGGTLTLHGCVDGRGLVTLTVDDTGCGVEAANLSRVFDPFFSTKGPGEGTGLGLAITHRIVEQHGGRVRLDNLPGSGARVTFELPVSPAQELSS